MTQINYKIRDYNKIEAYMLECMNDVAHDVEHIYRVLGIAQNIAAQYNNINKDILVAAALLHDIGRNKEYNNPSKCHAIEGSKMASEFLLSIGWSVKDSSHVEQCISTHRFRTNKKPDTLEAKILFDADKLDATGAMGICRTLLYKGKVNEPIYTIDDNKNMHMGDISDPESFVKEYILKLSKLYELFYTEEAKKIAYSRRKNAEEFFGGLLSELSWRF